jgi:hypothetical protein
VSYPNASRSPKHSFTPALLRSVQAEGSSYRLYQIDADFSGKGLMQSGEEEEEEEDREQGVHVKL